MCTISGWILLLNWCENIPRAIVGEETFSRLTGGIIYIVGYN
jgi:hypothetical protein